MKTNLEQIVISEDASLLAALEQINSAATGTLFVVDKRQKISGVLTDGDIRRALLRQVRLEDKVAVAMNRSFIAVRQDEVTDEFVQQLDNKISYLPVVDERGSIVGYYSYVFRSKIPVAKPFLNGNEAKYVNECLATNWISSQGRFVREFEKRFAGFCGVRYGVATTNGTTALHLALAALGIGPGDEVIVPSLTFVATANAVTYTGATPVFVDSEFDTWNIDPSKIETAITKRTKAIMPVHLYGQPAKMDEIMDLSDKYKLYVIEDAAEAHGARYKGRMVGSIGHVGCFSFFGNKIITTGEGGMLVTNAKDVFEKGKALRDHGMSPDRKYWHPHVGFNYRLTNIQAAIGLAQLERIDDILSKKQECARAYTKYLSGFNRLLLPPENSWSQNVFWMYSVVLKGEPAFRNMRDKILDELNQSNIECRPFFYPVHKMPPYYSDDTLEVAEHLSQNGINLPSYVGLDENEINGICATLRETLS